MPRADALSRTPPRWEVIPSEEITGTTRHPSTVGSDLLPEKALRTAHWKNDWRRVRQAVHELRVLPPVDLIKAGDEYFIVDGHKRVAAAQQVGGAVDAIVVELHLHADHASATASTDDRPPPKPMPATAIPLRRLAVATGLASVGLAAGGTGGALLATELAGSQAVAGLPFGLVVTGAAVGAIALSSLTGHIGRARALAAGYLLGVAGAGVVVAGAMAGSMVLVLVGSVLLGPANAAVFLGRYAAAELVAEARRARAMGVILFATAIGAVLAPNLLAPAGALAGALRLSEASGLHLVAIVAFGVGAVILAREPTAVGGPATHSAMVSWQLPPGRRWMALGTLGAANLAMVGIMAVAPVHHAALGHDYAFIGLAISLHVAAMFGPAPLTGWLCDRWRSNLVAVAGGGLLLLAGAWGAIADQEQPLPAAGSLLLLGLGWNLAVVAGSAMLTSHLRSAQRRRAEASGEVAMGLGAGLGASAAGVLAALAGWPLMALAAGGVGALAIIGFGSAVVSREQPA